MLIKDGFYKDGFYDKLTIILKDGTKKEIFFEITDFLGRYKE